MLCAMPNVGDQRARTTKSLLEDQKRELNNQRLQKHEGIGLRWIDLVRAFGVIERYSQRDAPRTAILHRKPKLLQDLQAASIQFHFPMPLVPSEY